MPKILVVDDNETFRTALCMTLEKWGYDVQQAADGREALTQQHATPSEILLTDLIMPDKEGLETIQDFRRQHPNVVIIAMSAGGRMDAKDMLKMARQFGASQTLSKPFSQTELEDAINLALETA